MARPSIFRQAALDRLSSPEQLDQASGSGGFIEGLGSTGRRPFIQDHLAVIGGIDVALCGKRIADEDIGVAEFHKTCLLDEVLNLSHLISV